MVTVVVAAEDPTVVQDLRERVEMVEEEEGGGEGWGTRKLLGFSFGFCNV